jgi:hypothetical protein
MKSMTYGIALLVSGAILLGGSGCVSSEAADEGGKLASSYQALIEQTLGHDDLSEFESQVVTSARDRGTISENDYRAAHDRYRSCMAQSGVEIQERTFPNGVIESTPPGPSETHSIEELATLDFECATGTITVIDSLYVVQQGNPELHRDPAEAGAKCLVREGVAPTGFTRDDFAAVFPPDGNEEYDKLPFDVTDERAAMCLFTAGIALAFESR